MSKNSLFFNNGFLSYGKIIDPIKCKKLNDSILKIRKIDKNIFLSKKEYLKLKKPKKKIKSKNILNKFNLDFILKNKRLQKEIKFILGNNYKLYASRIICGIPQFFFPSWITQKLDLYSPNLGEFIKQEFRDIRYFHGIDFHMDLIDFSKEKSDFITVYVYLDKVTKKMSPLNLLPKTHFGGADIYPHNLKKKRKEIVYKPKNGKIIKSKIIKLTGFAGNVWAWHGCLLHGTNFNIEGDKPRLSLRLIFRQTKNTDSLINKVNKKISNIVAYTKMRQSKRYKLIKKKFHNVSKYY